MPICIALIAGILFAPLKHELQESLNTALVLTFLATFGATLWGRPRIALAFALLTFALSGAALHNSFMAPGNPKHLTRVSGEGRFDFAQTTEITGVVDRHPERYPDKINLVVEVDKLRQKGRTRETTGKVLIRVHLSDRWLRQTLPFRTGDRVRLFAKLRKPDPPGNPGGFDYPEYLRRQGIVYTGSVGSPAAVEICRRGLGLPGASQVSSLRAALEKQIRRHFSSAGHLSQQGALLQAMILGNRGEISQNTKRLLRRCGLLHIIAISGYHVWVLTLIVFFLLRLSKVPDRWASVVTILVVAVYWTISGGRSSAGRACLVGIIFLLGRVFYKRPVTINSLALAAFAILALSPAELYSAGFQLTFAAAFSIALLYRPLVQVFSRIGWLAPVVAVALAAQIGVLPLTAFHFNIITPHSVLTSTLLIPAVSLTIILGFFYLFLALVFPIAGGIIGGVVALLLGVTLYSTRFFDTALPLAIRGPAPPIWLLTGYYAGLLLWIAVDGTRLKDKLPALPFRVQVILPLLPLTTTAILLILNPFSSPAVGAFRLNMIDVGQGEAILLELPDGSTALVDGGGTPHSLFDVGENLVSEFLWHRGYRKIDLMVSTHSDTDHIEGLISVMHNFRVEELWLTEAAEENKHFEELVRLGREKGCKIRHLQRDDVFRWRDTLWTCLNPPYSAYQGKNSANRNSLVVKVQLGWHSLLLTGDVDALALMDILARYKDELDCDILKIPHHGSGDALDQEFYKASTPEVALISAGRRNIHRFPSSAVIQALEEADIAAYRTDLHGAVCITFHEDGKIDIAKFLHLPSE